MDGSWMTSLRITIVKDSQRHSELVGPLAQHVDVCWVILPPTPFRIPPQGAIQHPEITVNCELCGRES